MRVKIKHGKIISHTPKAILVYNPYTQKDCWLPKSAIKFVSEFKLIIPKNLAVQKGFYFEELRHIPKKIEPIYNQEALDELRLSK